MSIFLYLDYDSLCAAEATCAHFRDLVHSSLLIWSRKVRSLLRHHNLHYLAYRRIGRQAGQLRRFYRCLRQLEDNILAGQFTKR